MCSLIILSLEEDATCLPDTSALNCGVQCEQVDVAFAVAKQPFVRCNICRPTRLLHEQAAEPRIMLAPTCSTYEHVDVIMARKRRGDKWGC